MNSGEDLYMDVHVQLAESVIISLTGLGAVPDKKQCHPGWVAQLFETSSCTPKRLQLYVSLPLSLPSPPFSL